MTPRLWHVGNAMVDLVMHVPHLPERAGDMMATSTRAFVGGGFNVMAAAARQGMGVTACGLSGTGPFGEMVRHALDLEGIEVLQDPVPDADTGTVTTMVEPDGERTFLTSPGAEATLTADHLERVRPAAGDWVHVSGYSLALVSNCAALAGWLPTLHDDVVVVLDPGPLVDQLPPDALSLALDRADWCTVNTREAALLTGRTAPEATAGTLLTRTGRRGIVVRTGPTGCLVAAADAPDRVHTVPGLTVAAVDLNGAGDTHTGVLEAALASGADLLTAARRANVAAAISVTRHGPATAPSAAETDAALAGLG